MIYTIHVAQNFNSLVHILSDANTLHLYTASCTFYPIKHSYEHAAALKARLRLNKAQNSLWIVCTIFDQM